MNDTPSAESVSFRMQIVGDRLAGMRNKDIAVKRSIPRVSVGCYLRRAVRNGEVSAEALGLRRWKKPDQATLHDPRVIADAALAKILRDIRNRSGLGDAWSDIDIDTRNEICAGWRQFIIQAVENPLG